MRPLQDERELIGDQEIKSKEILVNWAMNPPATQLN